MDNHGSKDSLYPGGYRNHPPLALVYKQIVRFAWHSSGLHCNLCLFDTAILLNLAAPSTYKHCLHTPCLDSTFCCADNSVPFVCNLHTVLSIDGKTFSLHSVDLCDKSLPMEEVKVLISSKNITLLEKKNLRLVLQESQN